MSDDLQKLRDDYRTRLIKQNDRRVAKGKKPKNKIAKLPAESKPKAAKLPKPESGNIDDSAMSFDEWSNIGYHVKKGERSELSDALGIPQFTMNQVRKINPAWQSWRK